MAQEAFEIPLGNVPNMDLEEIISHVKMMDPRVYFDLVCDQNPDDIVARNFVLEWLQTREPVLYEALENVLRAYQTAYFQASETRNMILRSYHRYRTARNTMEDDGRNLNEELEKQIEQETPAREKKRLREPRYEEAEQAELDNIKELKHATNMMCEWFLTQEKFTKDFPIKDYRHFVKKGQKKWQMAELEAYGLWDTIYHATGPWQAELLVEHLEKLGKDAIIVKKFRGGGDQEMMSYKVISGKKFRLESSKTVQ